MTLVKDFFKAHDLPKWLTGHKLFKEVTTITKVFPGIGLANCTEDYALNNIGNLSMIAAKIITDIGSEMERKKATLDKRLTQKISKDTTEKVTKVSELITTISALIKAAPNTFLIKNSNGTLAISLSQDISLVGSTKALFRKGERLFRVCFKLNEMLVKAKCKPMRDVEQFPSFKQFSAANMPPKPLKIVFSSDGVDGLWDIATMSMRGITSCQAWTGQYHQCLIGSILDPFVGIIYYTSGKANDTGYGSKMIRRSIVRFAINKETKDKHLVLDNMYPSYDADVAQAFIGFLRQKTGGKIKVASVNNGYGYGYGTTTQEDIAPIAKLYMPQTTLRAKISSGKDRNEQFQSVASYQDTFIKSEKSDGKDPKAILFDKNSAKKMKRFTKVFNKAFKTAIEKIEIDSLPEAIQPAIKKIIGKKKKTPTDQIIEDGGLPRDDEFPYNHGVIMKAISKLVAEEVIATVDKKEFDNSDTYIRRVYYNYFLRKNEIFDAVKAKVVKQINGNVRVKANKVNSKDIVLFLNALTSFMDGALKDKLKELAEKRKKNFSGPAPLPACHLQ